VSRGAALKRNFELLTRSMKRKRSDVQTTLLQHSALSRTRMVLGAYKRCVQAGGRKYEGGGVPTSGLVLIFNLKDVCGQITVRRRVWLRYGAYLQAVMTAKHQTGKGREKFEKYEISSLMHETYCCQ
jgi:hypothetical protein